VSASGAGRTQRAEHGPAGVDDLDLAVAREGLGVRGQAGGVPAVVAGVLTVQVRRRLCEGACTRPRLRLLDAGRARSSHRWVVLRLDLFQEPAGCHRGCKHVCRRAPPPPSSWVFRQRVWPLLRAWPLVAPCKAVSRHDTVQCPAQCLHSTNRTSRSCTNAHAPELSPSGDTRSPLPALLLPSRVQPPGCAACHASSPFQEQRRESAHRRAFKQACIRAFQAQSRLPGANKQVARSKTPLRSWLAGPGPLLGRPASTSAYPSQRGPAPPCSLVAGRKRFHQATCCPTSARGGTAGERCVNGPDCAQAGDSPSHPGRSGPYQSPELPEETFALGLGTLLNAPLALPTALFACFFACFWIDRALTVKVDMARDILANFARARNLCQGSRLCGARQSLGRILSSSRA